MSQKSNQNPGRTGGSTSAKPVVFTAGLVSQVDDKKGWARCTLPDLENLETYWLKVLQPNTKDNQVYWMPDVGEQVMVIADENLEEGCILGGIYSEADKPPVDKRDKYHVKWKNGDYFEYDRSTQTLKLKLKKIDLELAENLAITNQQESTINNKAIAVIGAMDNDSESNGPDALVTSGQGAGSGSGGSGGSGGDSGSGGSGGSGETITVLAPLVKTGSTVSLPVATPTTNGYLLAADKAKLDAVAVGATANQSDAFLLDRVNHTGTQAIATVLGLEPILDFFGVQIASKLSAETDPVWTAEKPSYLTIASASTTYVPLTRTVNGKALSANIAIDKSDLGLSNVPNLDTSNPANIVQSAAYRFVTDTEKATWNGKQNVLGYIPLNPANNLSDLGNAGTARTNLGLAIGTNVQAYSSLLADIVSNFAGAADGQFLRKSGTAIAYGTPAGSLGNGSGIPVLSNTASFLTTRITFSAGETLISGGYAQTSGMVKRLDATWASGTNNGGRFTGVSLSANTTYHVFAMRNTSTGAADFGFDTSATGANRPSGWEVKAIGAIMTDGSSAIRRFFQSGPEFLWDNPIDDLVAIAIAGSQLLNLTVPTGVEVTAILNLFSGLPAFGTANYCTLRYPGSTTPNTGIDLYWFYISSTFYSYASLEKRVRTNTGRQVRLTCAGNNEPAQNFVVSTMGFVYPIRL